MRSPTAPVACGRFAGILCRRQWASHANAVPSTCIGGRSKAEVSVTDAFGNSADNLCLINGLNAPSPHKIKSSQSGAYFNTAFAKLRAVHSVSVRKISAGFSSPARFFFTHAMENKSRPVLLGGLR